MLCFMLPEASAQTVDGKVLVSPSLITAAKEATQPFTVGVRFKIAPDWHLYWKNAGDAGLPIDVKWTLPAGFTASAIEFPTPHKTVQSGIVAYGYDTEVILLTRITPPKNFKATDKVKLQAALDWLVCREECVPGKATVDLTLGSLSTSDLAAAQKLLTATESQLPLPLSQSTLEISRASLKTTGDKRTLEIALKGNELEKVSDFFPEPFENFTLIHADIKVSGGVITIPLTPNEKGATLKSIKGLVILNGKGYDLQTPVNAASTGSLIDQTFKVQGESESLSLGWVLLLAFVGGVILNVMPCVLPVLSLKVLGFVQQSGKSASANRTLSLWFTAGVLISFWALALVVVLLQSAGQQVGWGFQFQSPMFVLAMTTVVFIFGLNLVGVFEFAAPAVSGSVGKSLSRNDQAGALMNGVLATTLATPCTAPFLGTALGFAFSQPAWVVFAVLTLVALGLSAPYVVLSWNPAWLKFVPKPGAWMNRFKEAMGFLLFATAAWLLTVIGAQLGVEGATWTVAFLIAVAFAMWLIGQLDYTSTVTSKLTVWVTAVMIIGGSYYWMFERELRWRELENGTTPLAPVESSNGESGSNRNKGIAWKPFSLAGIETAVGAGNAVFIDFTADWCFTCKVTEKTILETDKVRGMIEKLGIVPVKADWTNRNDEITQLLKKFGRSGVPLYVVFPAGNLSEPIVLPEVITTDLLLDAFSKAASQPAASVVH